MHTYGGEKLEMMRANPEVCFQVDHVVRLAQWSSVMAWGRVEELKDDLAVAAMNLLAWRLRDEVPGETAGPVGRHGRELGTALRIPVATKTGRSESPA